jgi:hypothetical protein
MGRRVVDTLHGHLWTILPKLADTLSPVPAPHDEPWETTVPDPRLGSVRLTGWLRTRPHDETLFVLIHGLGGSHDSYYVTAMARWCDRVGASYLRFNMRGADRSGEDLYHAGTTDDLRAMLASERLARFSTVYLVGFSMGGHLVLRWATEPGRDARVAAVASVCAPLDLGHGAVAIQRPLGLPYQWHVLRGLKEMLRHADMRGRAPVPFERARAIRTILEWDEAVVVPRFGFASRAHYYESQSAGPRLPHVDLPTLFVAAERDPMVTADQLRPWLAEASDAVEVAWTSGGHIGFPHLALAAPDPGPLEPQVLRWLLRHRPAR